MPKNEAIKNTISLLTFCKELVLLSLPIALFIKKLIDLQNFDMLKLDYSLSNVNKQYKIRFRLLLKSIFKGFLTYVILFIVISPIFFLIPDDTKGIIFLFALIIYTVYLLIHIFLTKRLTPYNNYFLNFCDTIFLFMLINFCILFISFNKDTLKPSFNSIYTILIASHLVGRVKLIIISSIVCLLSIYDISRTYINTIANHSFAYFYTNTGAKAYIYSSNNTMALCMPKPYNHYYGENKIKKKLKKFEKNLRKSNLSVFNKLKEHIDNIKKYNDFINTDDIKYFFDNLDNKYTALNSANDINSCISEFKGIAEEIEKLTMITEIDLSTIKEFYPVINEEQNSYFK